MGTARAATEERTCRSAARWHCRDGWCKSKRGGAHAGSRGNGQAQRQRLKSIGTMMLVGTEGGGAGIGDERRTRLTAASSRAWSPEELTSLTDSTSPLVLKENRTATEPRLRTFLGLCLLRWE